MRARSSASRHEPGLQSDRPASVRSVSPAAALRLSSPSVRSPSANGVATLSKWIPRNITSESLALPVRSGFGSSLPLAPSTLHVPLWIPSHVVLAPDRSPVTNSAPSRPSTVPSAWPSRPWIPEARPSGHSSSGSLSTL